MTINRLTLYTVVELCYTKLYPRVSTDEIRALATTATYVFTYVYH